jgi:RNA polymerase sigma-54 factor
MKQTQTQTIRQKMALTQHMRSSLSLLLMGAEDVARAIEDETRRNPFLKPVPAAPSGGAQASDQTVPDVAAAENLSDDLIRQIGLIRLTADQQRLAVELVHCLDPRGFFEDPLEEMCAYLSTQPDKLRAIVAKLQEAVEPAGVFAWGLADSFAAQLRAKNLYDPLIAQLLERLDLVAAQDIPAICDLCRVDAEDAADMLADIRNLTPSPMARTVEPVSVARAPDLIMRAQETEIEVALNPAALPDMLTDDALFSTVKTVETDTKALAYYRDCYRTAGAFVIAMQKRANTLLRLGQHMAEVQEKFLRTGRPLDRSPLTMGGLARALGLNKSTVSRALNNCLIDGPRGVLVANDLLVRPLSDEAGEKTRDHVLRRLSLLIKTEDQSAPLSDQDLCNQLARLNLVVSRRTVAKYRGLLDIPNAQQRKRR